MPAARRHEVTILSFAPDVDDARWRFFFTPDAARCYANDARLRKHARFDAVFAARLMLFASQQNMPRFVCAPRRMLLLFYASAPLMSPPVFAPRRAD